MIRPSDQCLELYKDYPDVVSKNLENLIEEFQKGDTQLKEFPGPVIDLMFSIFVMGVTTVLNPGSAFNKKHVIR